MWSCAQLTRAVYCVVSRSLLSGCADDVVRELINAFCAYDGHATALKEVENLRGFGLILPWSLLSNRFNSD